MDIIQKISALIAAQADWAGPLGFVIAFFGCLVGSSFVVPAAAIVTATGVLIGAGVVSWTFVLWAIGGAVLGMSVSYELGKRCGPRLLEMRMLQSRQQLVARVRGLFERYGIAAIMVGYHIGPARALVTSVAGITGMPRLKFETASIVSAMVWIVDHALIGVIPGTLIDADSPWLLPVTLGAPVVVIVLTVLLLRKAF